MHYYVSTDLSWWRFLQWSSRDLKLNCVQVFSSPMKALSWTFIWLMVIRALYCYRRKLRKSFIRCFDFQVCQQDMCIHTSLNTLVKILNNISPNRHLWWKQNQCRQWRWNFMGRPSRWPKREKSCSDVTTIWLSSRLINPSTFQDRQVSSSFLRFEVHFKVNTDVV